MHQSEQTSRRDFMKTAAATGGALFLGFNWFTASATPKVVDAAKIAAGGIDFNSYLSIDVNDVITIISPNPEIGQGIKTAFPMVVAEELDADWKKVVTIQGNLDNQKFDRQLTGGSGAVPHSWEKLRKAGASARYLLIQAAANRWQVAVDTCTTHQGVITHKSSGRTFRYGELAVDASKIALPADVK